MTIQELINNLEEIKNTHDLIEINLEWKQEFDYIGFDKRPITKGFFDVNLIITPK